MKQYEYSIWKMIALSPKDLPVENSLEDVSLAAASCLEWWKQASKVFPGLSFYEYRSALYFVADDISQTLGNIEYELHPSCGCCPDCNYFFRRSVSFLGQKVHLKCSLTDVVGEESWDENEDSFIKPAHNLDWNKYSENEKIALQNLFKENAPNQNNDLE